MLHSQNIAALGFQHNYMRNFSVHFSIEAQHHLIL